MPLSIGIIAEGRTDQFVLRNILYAFDVSKNAIRFVRPELQIDETDRVNIPPTTFGSWTNVKNNCINRTPFVDFFDNNIAGEKLMIVQLDTDVCSE